MAVWLPSRGEKERKETTMDHPANEPQDGETPAGAAPPLPPPPPMPLLSISSPATLQKCASLALRNTDIFICSYPKSGTTWLQHIVLSLLWRQAQNDGDATRRIPPYQHVSDYAPFLEIDPHWPDDDNDDDAMMMIVVTSSGYIIRWHRGFAKITSDSGDACSTRTCVGTCSLLVVLLLVRIVVVVIAAAMEWSCRRSSWRLRQVYLHCAIAVGYLCQFLSPLVASSGRRFGGGYQL